MSSLSPESVEQVLSALSRQKSVGKVCLPVRTITVTTAALCLDFIQNTETCRNLKIQDNSSPPSSLSVEKDSRGLRVASSLSPESVEQVLSALSRKKSVDNVRLSVPTITVTTSALCLDFIQNTETCHYLKLTDDSSPPSSLSVIKDSRGLRLHVVDLSDADVGVLISALGEGKNLTELSVAKSSLSPESVEQVLSALSRQKSVGKVHLSVTTITVTTAALCLDVIQNTETCRYLKLMDNSSSSLSVDKESKTLSLDVNAPLSSIMTPASLTLSQADSPTSGSFTDFIHKFRWTLPCLGRVELRVSCLTESWAHWILSLIHTCPTLKEVEGSCWADGLLLEEGISLLQESDKRPDCTVILTGRRCTKPSGKCSEENDPLLPCNQHVTIQI